jgi:hypothetical protein
MARILLVGNGEEMEKTMFAWRSLDPKVTAEVIRILAQRLSRARNRAPKKDGKRVPPWTSVRKVSDELPE